MKTSLPKSISALLVALVVMVGLMVAPARAQEASPVASPTAGTGSFELTGLVNTPGTVTAADLQALTPQTVEVDFQSGQGDQHHAYTGVLLWDVLDKAGITLNPDVKNDVLHKYVVLTATDGYEVVISLGEIDPGFGANQYLLAWEEDGAALPLVRLVLPGDIKGGRYISDVVKIEVRDIDSAPRS
jgi:DMSO/TMAO reductase YedYZ molybdopterin-dependent catalytic subunit